MPSHIEVESRKFQQYFTKHPDTHCDPKRSGDLLPNLFCQLNGQPIKEAYTCCPENKYHYLVNGQFETKERDIPQQIQKSFNRTKQKCPTCHRMGKEITLKAEFDESLDREIRNYYELKYTQVCQQKFICAKTKAPIKNPVVICGQEMHGFIDSSALPTCKTCPIDPTHEVSEDLKVHTFLDYALKRYQKEQIIEQYKNEHLDRNQEFRGCLTRTCHVLTHRPYALCPKSPTHWIANKKEALQLFKTGTIKCFCGQSFIPLDQQKVHPILRSINIQFSEDEPHHVPDIGDTSTRMSRSVPLNPPPRGPTIMNRSVPVDLYSSDGWTDASSSSGEGIHDSSASPFNDANHLRLRGIKRICVNGTKLIACIALVVIIGMLFVRFKNRVWTYRLVR
ncbi:MAG TPA: hypothetical protein PLO43_01620 [Chlamydiales bacterium]|nr:hypothetical protein [Chlamydiales bacterium]